MIFKHASVWSKTHPGHTPPCSSQCPVGKRKMRPATPSKVTYILDIRNGSRDFAV